MAKRTVTSKGLRVRLKSANKQIEVLTGSIKGLKQQVLLKEQTITHLRNLLDDSNIPQPNECTESVPSGDDSGHKATAPALDEQRQVESPA